MLGIFLDTETNGLDVKIHKVLEIAFKIIDLNDGSSCATFSSLIAIPPNEWDLSDKTSLQVNGLSWEEVSKGAPVQEVASEIKHLFISHKIVRGKAVFICQNPSFDRVFFSQLLSVETQEFMKIPYHWLDLASMFWSYCMLQSKEKTAPLPWEIGFTKDKIASYFQIASENHPHRALQGVEHLIKCYEAVVGFPKKMLV